jgi:U3 small nucleolar RNA-associated protein 23
MRGKRSKQYRKLMHAYALTFHFRAPYQVLLSSTIIRDAARFKMQLGHMLSNTLHGEIKPMITQCCIRHLYNAVPEPGQERDKEAWIDVAKQAERRRCGHHELETPLSELECINSVLDPKGSGTNKHRYVVATQEREVRAAMREVAGVPLVYINRSVMVMEPMAGRSAEVREAEEKSKVRAGLKSRRGAEVSGEKRKADDGLDGEGGGAAAKEADLDASVPKRKKPKGPSGPNPLSVKKSKKEDRKPQEGGEKKSHGRVVEDERSVIRKAAKQDPQAGEKALSAEVALGEGGVSADAANGTSGNKRTRKRKPKDAASAPSDEAVAAAVRTAISDARYED